MNWPFVFQCIIYGLLTGVWTVGSGIYILPGMPDAFGWLKLVASAAVSFVGGVFLFTRNPKGAWDSPPGTPGGQPKP